MKKIAIIGHAFRFPGGANEKFWDQLVEGADLVTSVEPSRWAQQPFLHPDRSHPGTTYTFAAGSIGDISQFDASFFGISPREAALMDPQQRLLLELTHEALEHAGVRPQSIRGSDCGVFVGISAVDYFYRMMDDLHAIDSSVATGNTFSIAANRISYHFDLRGPSVAVDTACSSSLVAFHQACQSILNGESTQALAGGVSLHIHPVGFVTFSKASMLSKTGRCRVFDAAADGYVRSEGGAVILLKDFDAAVADGDQILAVVAGSGVNTDGRKAGLTVPSSKAQAELLDRVYARAGIDPSEVNYIEAHGTGTPVGDPIETYALGEAIGKKRPATHPLLIGSVKSNIGHLEAASGMAGLMKALLALRHRKVPPTIGITEINPKIKSDEWNLRIVREPTTLPRSGKLIVGVNSFGFGGANAHVILESYESPHANLPRPAATGPIPIVVTSKTPEGLRESISRIKQYLSQAPRGAYYDIAYTTCFYRDWHPYRAVVLAESPEKAVQRLDNFSTDNSAAQPVSTLHAPSQASGPAFIYTGNGSQWVSMGRKLLDEDAVFRRAVREIDFTFGRLGDFSVEEELRREDTHGTQEAASRMSRTDIAQPTLFAVQVGLTEMLRSRGVYPTAVAGHSVGEVAAAWAAGALTLEAAVKVVYFRSKLQEATRGTGGMTAVSLSASETQSLIVSLGLSEELSIAGVNSPSGVTIAGAYEALKEIEDALKKTRVRFKRLNLEYAFHSAHMNQIEVPLEKSLARLKAVEGRIPLFSTVTGDSIDGRELTANYWWFNIRKPVRFHDAISSMLSKGINVFVEVGPAPILRSYLTQCAEHAGIKATIIPTLTRGIGDESEVTRATEMLLISGGAVQWEALFPWRGLLRDLPHYAWQKERFWMEPSASSGGLLTRQIAHPLVGFAGRNHGHDLTWQGEIDTRRLPSLAHHIVGESVVFPGSAFAEIVCAIANQALRKGSTRTTDSIGIEVHNLEIHTPLTLSDKNSVTLLTRLAAPSGEVTISSRTHAETTTNLHATAKVLMQPSTHVFSLRARNAIATPTRRPDFSAASHQKLTQAAGLSYGESYAAISHGWVENNSAIAVFSIPNSIKSELATHLIHPALLDCAFQLILHLVKPHSSAEPNFVFVPTKIERISVIAGTHVPHSARTTLRRSGSQMLSADVELVDEDGLPIASYTRVQLKRLAMHNKRDAGPALLRHSLIPAPHPDGRDLISASQVAELFATLARLSTDLGAKSKFVTEVEPLLDALCRTTLASFIDEHSNDAATQRHEAGRIEADLDYSRTAQLDYFKVLAKANGIGRTNSTERSDVSPDQMEVAGDVIWRCLLDDYPEFFAFTRMGAQFLATLSAGSAASRSDKRAVLKLTDELIIQAELGVQGLESVSQSLVGIIKTHLAESPVGQTMTIAEVCAKPMFAKFICDKLSSSEFTYRTYLNDSSSTELGDLSSVNSLPYEVIPAHQWDASEPSSSKHFGSADVALITLPAIGALESGRPSEYLFEQIVRAGKLVSKGGLLLLFGRGLSLWNHCFAWCNATDQTKNALAKADPDWRPNARFLSLLLKDAGLEPLGHFALGENDSEGTYILAARSEAAQTSLAQATDSHLPEQTVVVVRDRGCEFADSVVGKIRANGAQVREIIATTTEAIRPAVASLLTSDQSISSVLDLVGYAQPRQDNPAQRPVQLANRALIASQLAEAIADGYEGVPLWVATRVGHLGTAMADVPPWMRLADGSAAAPQLGENSRLEALDDAALWGWCRSLANEHSRVSIRLAALGLAEDATPDVHAISALCRDVLSPTSETEIVYSPAGGRFAPRLKTEPAITSPDVGSSATLDGAAPPIVKLRLGQPGLLHDLRWERSTPAPISTTQVRVRVLATGLNFRDVMFAMGLLDEESIANGFAGPTLGLEFSGIVEAVGPGVGDLKIGDRVLGFGPACFGSMVTTERACVSAMPDELSFEGAATIPSAFFTSYYSLVRLARLRQGERVLIHGGAGGVGLAAIQVAKMLGAEIFATVGTEEKRGLLRLLGVEHIYDSRSLSFADEIELDTNGVGVDVILNSLSGEAITHNLRLLKPGGRFIELGKRDFLENTRVGIRPFRNNISYFGVDADQLMSIDPNLTAEVFSEVMTGFERRDFRPLPYESFDANDIVEAFRYMQHSHQIGKIVVTYDTPIKAQPTSSADARPALALDPDGAYLVTGGLGGFGLKCAQWLVGKGAKTIVLAGRRGVSAPDTAAVLERLAETGVQVITRQCDVSDFHQVSSLIDELEAKNLKLRGIVHAAMVIEDALCRNVTAAQLEKVLSPKVRGAKNLHLATTARGIKLDFFLLCSSATTLFGNPGQASYVAANAWIEAFATYRRARGLAGTSVLLGALSDTGFLFRNREINTSLASRMGETSVTSDEALAVIEQMLLHGESGLGVLRLDWRTLQGSLRTSGTPRFTTIADRGRSGSATGQTQLNITEMLEANSDEVVLAQVLGQLQEVAARILRTAPDKVDVNRSFLEMGLDSLMGVELLTSIEERFSMNLPPMVLSENPNLSRLAARLVEIAKSNAEPLDHNDSLLKQATSLASRHGVELTSDIVTHLVSESGPERAPSNRARIH